MRVACLIAVLCAFGCSQDAAPSVTDNLQQPVADDEEQQQPAFDTLDNVIYCPGGSPNQQPLMCLPGKDFPEGREMTFRDAESGEFVHAVFPKAAAAPENLDGSFVLHGHYQGIQNWDAFKPSDTKTLVKQPPRDYQYFVVSSWEHEESIGDGDQMRDAR